MFSCPDLFFKSDLSLNYDQSIQHSCNVKCLLGSPGDNEDLERK